MPLPSFTVTGNVFDILGNVAGGELVENGFGAGTPVTVTFIPNVPINVFVTWAGHLERVPPVPATINSDGTITRNGSPVQLLANDPGLSITGLQWTVAIGPMARLIFDAPLDGTTLNLITAVPVPAIPITILPSLPVSGLIDATPFTKGFLTSVHDAGEARTLIGVSLVALDDIVWYANSAAFPGSGVVDEVYGARDTGKLYLWTGSSYVAARASVTSADITDSTAVGRSLVTAADAAGARTALAVPGPSYASITALRAATAADGVVRLLGYYSAGDGGGGSFRWDATDTTSTDNGGTIITPSSGLSSSGRWKRVYEGEVNARWFGVNPSQSDNTAALQKAVDWVCRVSDIGGTVFIPMGLYLFTFSGSSTITIGADNVLIRGEGKGSRLKVTGHARPSQVNYFFTFTQSGRGQGGGVRDINFFGNSMLKWCIYLNTWRDASFENISAYDVHAGILDAEATNTTYYGEGIVVRNVDHSGASGTTVTQYGVRFRGGSNTGAKTWSDCFIRDGLFIQCWDSGVMLDGVMRFAVSNIVAACNSTFTDSIDASSKSGCLHGVQITKSATVDIADVTGFHIVDGVYLESLQGSETAATNNAVFIHQLNIAFQIQQNQISNITGNGTVGLLKLTDDSGAGRLNNTTFRGNRNPISGNIIIGASVDQTDLYLTPNDGRAWDALISDSGTNTRVNGAPTAGIVLRPPPAVYDSFTAANSSAPDSSRWTTSIGAGAGADISVQGNALQLTSGYSGGGYTTNDDVRLTSTVGATLADGEIEFCLTSSSVTVDSFLHVALRSAAAAPWIGATAYFLQIEQAASGAMITRVVKRVASSDTPLYATPSATMTAGQKTWFRFRVKGTTLQLWTWADGAQIPRVPAFTGTDSGVTGGGLATFALLRTGSAAAIQKIDNAAVYAL